MQMPPVAILMALTLVLARAGLLEMEQTVLIEMNVSLMELDVILMRHV
jgi:hypothetical protein